MKRKFRFAFVIAIALALTVSVGRAAEDKEETLGDKLKKLFVRPPPKPKAHKKKKVSPAAAKSPTASPSATSASSESAPESSATPPEQVAETPVPTATPAQTTSTAPAKSGTQYFDAVRPISPPPRRRSTIPPRRTAPQPQGTPFSAETIMPETPSETPVSRPIPSLPRLETNSEAPLMTPTPSATAQGTPSPAPTKTPAPGAAVSLEQIEDSPAYPPEIRKIVDLAVGLTGRNLTYKYASADPANGGMDCSGFIYYVLRQSGVQDVPRDAREQYIWVRKAGNFQAVLAQRDDTFELDGLRPGDLLFWASNYGISKDPDIMQTMIYLGREKGTNRRLMVGASENRSTKAQKKSAVGVLEFKIARTAPKANQETGPIFVGYGHIPSIGGK